jgi:uncharacterized protein
MAALITAIFLASLLGSLHCAGMCGAFLAFAVGTAGPGSDVGAADRGILSRVRSNAALQAAYHLGRLFNYMCFGAAAGTLGAALDLGGSLVGLQQTAAIAAGLMMIAFGAICILRIKGIRLPKPPVPPLMKQLLLKGHRAAFDMPPIRRALVIGLLTTLLPCGWLYAFVITSAGTGHPALGALAMAVFWVGTLPVMVALGSGLQSLTGVLGRHIPLATALAIVAVGVFTVFQRISIPMASVMAATPTSIQEAIDKLEHIDEEPLPCCAQEAP